MANQLILILVLKMKRKNKETIKAFTYKIQLLQELFIVEGQLSTSHLIQRSFNFNIFWIRTDLDRSEVYILTHIRFIDNSTRSSMDLIFSNRMSQRYPNS